MNVVK